MNKHCAPKKIVVCCYVHKNGIFILGGVHLSQVSPRKTMNILVDILGHHQNRQWISSFIFGHLVLSYFMVLMQPRLYKDICCNNHWLIKTVQGDWSLSCSDF